jgi:hypothetical protein
MTRLAPVALALAASAAPVFAGGEVRDHRNDAPAPEVRDHRNEGAATDNGIRYRRRPGPRIMLPLKIDIGATGINTTHGYAPGLGVAVGVHWASLSPRPTDTDVGLGLFGALMAAPNDPTMTTMTTGTGVSMGGVYLEVAHTLAQGDFARVWAGGRGEYLQSSAFGETKKGFGATGRLSAELFVGGVGLEPRGVFLGSYAIGVYVEAGARNTVADVGMFHAGAGLTFRTPLVFAP